MDPRQVLIAQFLLNITTYALIMAWYVYPYLRRLPLERALAPLVLVHCVRTLGLFALVPAFVGPEVHQTTWAHHVAIGDTTTVALALITVILLKRGSSHAITAAWIFNIVGSVDIIMAGINATRDDIIERLGVQQFVVAFGVPALIVTHIAMFVLLIRGRHAADERARYR